MRSLGMGVLAVAVATFSSPAFPAERYVVQVVDPAGTPVAGARVEPVSPSINGVPVMTDKNGEAVVPKFIGQQTKWINVSKPGFQTTPNLELPAKWPWKLVLKPSDSRREYTF
jgi:hypothetical protein